MIFTALSAKINSDKFLHVTCHVHTSAIPPSHCCAIASNIPSKRSECDSAIFLTGKESVHLHKRTQFASRFCYNFVKNEEVCWTSNFSNVLSVLPSCMKTHFVTHLSSRWDIIGSSSPAKHSGKLAMADEEVGGGTIFSFDELVDIFGYLSPVELSKCSQVCRDWYEASQVGSLWKRHCLQRWNFCHLGKLKPGSYRQRTLQVVLSFRFA